MTIRIGLLGSGFVSNFYLQGLQGVADWEIPVVASPLAAHAASFAKKWSIPESTSDVADVIARKDLDLIVLGVPNQFHKDLVIQCARAGKHVVCTKPLARNRHEAREMLDAVEAVGILHGYAETEVFSPAVMKARDYIERGGIGRVLTVRSREAHSGPHAAWFWKKELSGGGALLDMGCHTIEAARYFIGKEHKIVETLAWTDRLVHHDRTDAEDNAVLLLRFDTGALAHVEFELDRPRRPRSSQRSVRQRRGDLHRRDARDLGESFLPRRRRLHRRKSRIRNRLALSTGRRSLGLRLPRRNAPFLRVRQEPPRAA